MSRKASFSSSGHDVHFPSLNIKQLHVSLDGEPVGILAQTNDGTVAFEYDKSWLSTGFSLNPFNLPLESRLFVANPHPFDGLFGVLMRYLKRPQM